MIYMKVAGEGFCGKGSGRYTGWLVLDSCTVNKDTKKPPTVISVAVTKEKDESSPGLMRWSLIGERRNVEIHFNSGDLTVLSIALEEVCLIYHLGGGWEIMELMPLRGSVTERGGVAPSGAGEKLAGKQRRK